MGLKGDLDEAKDLWSKGSWSLRAFAVVSVVMTAGSIASLSDMVFAWKGFIFEGVEMYNSLLWYLFSSLESWFPGVEYSRDERNALMVLGFQVLGVFRLCNLHRRDWEAGLLRVLLPALVFVPIALFFGVNSSDSDVVSLLVIIICWYFWVPASSVLTLYIQSNSSDTICYWGINWRKLLDEQGGVPKAAKFLTFRYLASPLAALCLVLIAGAINSGLVRSL